MVHDASRLGMLRWQLGLCWSLAELHLTGLTDEVCLWQPAAECWSVRQSADGQWRPDWVEPEPDPPPPATIGWLTWHLGWWWADLLAHAAGEQPRPREEVTWPGSAVLTVDWLAGLHDRWAAFLEDATEPDLDRPFGFPWPKPRPLAIAAAWANAELMKNVAEIGAVRHLGLAYQGQLGEMAAGSS